MVEAVKEEVREKEEEEVMETRGEKVRVEMALSVVVIDGDEDKEGAEETLMVEFPPLGVEVRENEVV